MGALNMNDTTAADSLPDAPRPPLNSVTLYIMLSRDFGSSIDYDAQTGKLSARCAARGHAWNTNGKFQFKQCSVTFRRHPTGLMPELAHEHGLAGACGIIELAAGLEPETFQDDGEEIALPPITVNIMLDDTGYDRTEKLLRACLTAGREASLSVGFFHHDFPRKIMTLDDVKLATKCVYPIVHFGLGGVRKDNTTVRVPSYRYDEDTAAGLMFTVSAASIQASVWNSEFSISEIKLTGKIRSSKLGIDSNDDTIEIKEYEENRGWKTGYPEEAFPGVVSVSKEETHIFCWVTLYATKEILRGLATLLAGVSKGDVVRFDVSMIAEGLPLKVGERKYFDVTGYTPTLLKSYS
jgi:hypothetical protein